MASTPLQPKAILVAGMHRSGTSAVTRLVSLLGADLPQRVLAAPSPDNSKGHFESEPIIRLHDEMLLTLGSSWDDVRAVPSDFRASAALTFRRRMVEALRQEFGQSPCFVLKDPRMCRFLPLWLDALAELKARPHFIITVRNPLEVVGSLHRRDGFTTAKSLLLWLRHVLAAEFHTRGHRRCFLTYSGLLADWRATTARMAADLDLTWSADSPLAQAKIDAFLSRDDQHHAVTLSELQQHAEVNDWVKSAYQALLAVAADATVNPAPAMDLIRGELAAADAAFGPLLGHREPVPFPTSRAPELDWRQAEAGGSLPEAAVAGLSKDACAALTAESRRARGIAKGALTIHFLVASPADGPTAQSPVLLAAEEMAARGHRVTLQYLSDPEGVCKSGLKQPLAARLGRCPQFEIAVGLEPTGCCDVVVATDYRTASAARRLRPQSALQAYFVQDFEPYLQPMGSNFLEARSVFRQDLCCVTIGRWLADLLGQEFGIAAHAVDFWLDRRHYFPGRRSFGDRRPRVVFFAAPESTQYCFALGAAALSVLHRRMPEVEIVLFSTDLPGELSVAFPYVQLSALAPQEAGSLFRSADLGLALSATNPSAVAFEMAACGLPVVDIDVLGGSARYGGTLVSPADPTPETLAGLDPYCDPSIATICFAEPTPDALASAMRTLLLDPEKLAEASAAAISLVRNLPSPADAIRQMSEYLEKEMLRRS